jgi:hypothetical protein
MTQELSCHNCQMYIQFDLDFEQDGCHTIKCPNCGHEHYRVVRNGRITSDRWASSQQQYIITNATYSLNSTSTSSSGWITWGGTTATVTSTGSW